jgi:uncharacterized protein YdhG (YjbR/CyaY superfamily)
MNSRSETAEEDAVDDAVHAYIEAIPPAQRALFDRLHGLILAAFPDVVVVLSYKMPTYKRGDRRLFVGAWKHGLSVYGWDEGRDEGFVARHPQLKTSTGTIRMRPADAAGLSDDELRDLIRAALDLHDDEES